MTALLTPLVAQQRNENPPPSEGAKPSPSTPAAAEAAAPVDPKTYKIGPEDILKIMVWREPELSGTLAVRPDGRITLPLVGEVEAGGLTPEALKDKVTEAYSKVVNKPEVMVSLVQVGSKKYYLVGEVNRREAARALAVYSHEHDHVHDGPHVHSDEADGAGRPPC